MTREEHIAWTKQRALAELEPGGSGISGAMASVQSDLLKHPDTQGHAAIEVMMLEAMAGGMRTPDQVRHFIDGIR